MKIACPQCGQHYEVEAGTLDRYFRCTECQMLFRGLNAKLVKERKFKRKNKLADNEKNAENNLENSETAAADPNATTAAVAVENMEKDAAEAEAHFWEKSLKEDEIAEKVVNLRKRPFNFSAYAPIICVVILLVTFVLAILSYCSMRELQEAHSQFDSKGSAHNARLIELEQQIEKIRGSIDNINSSTEKLERIVAHISSKVNDQTLARKVDLLSKELGRISENAADIRKLSSETAALRQEFASRTVTEKTVRKQQVSRR